MKRKTSTDLFYTKLVQDLIDRVPIKEEGTTRGSDPTAYSKGEIFFMKGNCRFKIKINNFWGTKVNIFRVVRRFPDLEDDSWEYNVKEIEVADLYLDRVWVRDKKGYYNEVTTWKRNKGVLKLMRYFVKTHEVWIDPRSLEDYFPDPMGILADYE